MTVIKSHLRLFMNDQLQADTRFLGIPWTVSDNGLVMIGFYRRKEIFVLESTSFYLYIKWLSQDSL